MSVFTTFVAAITLAMAVVFFILTMVDRTLGRIGRDPSRGAPN